MTNPARILIAEDDNENREALTLMLQLTGYQCLGAADGRIAIELALRAAPDVILMDLSLPEVDGLGAVRELRARGCQTPIIIVSAYDDIVTRQRAREAGANDYATKPLEFTDLKAAIETQLNRACR